MIPALAGHILANPHLPLPVLTHLLGCLRAPGRDPRERTRYVRAAASNPSLDAPILTQLHAVDSQATWRGVMARPGLNADDAVHLIGTQTHPQPWVSALSQVHDPDDVLVHAALTRARPHPETYGRALCAATTTAGRRAALTALASQPLHNSVHRDRAHQLLTAHADLAHLFGPRPHQRRSALTPPAAVSAGARQWLTRLAADPDPTELLPAAAVTAAADLGTDAVWVLGAALLDPRTAPDVAHVAARALLARWDLTSLPGPVQFALGDHLRHGPVDLVDAAITSTSTPIDLAALGSRTDLTDDQITALIPVMVGADARPAVGAMWALRLGTQPAATAAHRTALLELLGDPRAAGVEVRLACHVLALLGTEDRPARGAGAWSLAVWTYEARDVPGLGLATQAALDGLLPQLAEHSGPALLGIADGFRGTLSELITTAAALHH